MVIDNNENSLEIVDRIYSQRSRRARELKAEGNRIIGYFCSYTPVEILTAAGLVPFRITGEATGSYPEADSCVEGILCPYVRSCFDMALRREYDFLDGFVVPHACDNIQKIYDIWRSVIRPPYAHFVNVPHTITGSSLKFFKEELKTFVRSLEKAFDVEIPPEQIRSAIQLHNENRRLVRNLYELRKPQPPFVKGSEVLKTLVASMSLPVQEANILLKDVIEQLRHRKEMPEKKPARLLIQGAEMDSSAFMELVEQLQANVVVDDLCIGTRAYWHDVELTSDPMDGLAARYLGGINCPRTFKPRDGSYEQDLENRFGHLHKLIEEFNVNGVILDVMRYCDIFGFDVPDVQYYLKQLGIPVLYLEDSYDLNTVGQLRTRVQAFMEIIDETGKGRR